MNKRLLLVIAFLIFFLIALVVVLSSCSTVGIVSDDSSYLSATGYGPTAQEAALDARASLASVFGLSVESLVTRTVSEAYAAKGGESAQSYSDILSSVSSAYVNIEELYGVEITGSTRTKDGWTATASMNRTDSARIYSSQLEDLAGQIEDYEKRINGKLGSVEAVFLSSQLGKLYDAYNSKALIKAVLLEEKVSLKNLASLSEIQNKAREAVSFAIVLEDGSEDNSVVYPAVSKVLSDYQIPVSKESSHKTAEIRIAITWNDTEGSGSTEGYFFSQYDASLSVVDLAAGEVLYACQSHGREGHTNLKAARSRALSNIASDLSYGLSSYLDGILSW